MIKVRIIRGLTTVSALKAASAATLVTPALVACSAEDQESVGSDSQASTEAIAGSGLLSLQGWSLRYASTSGGDELVRVGEKMKVAVDHRSFCRLVARNDFQLEAALQSDPSKLKVELLVQYTKADGSSLELPAIPVAWATEPTGLVAGTSADFVIPPAIRRMKVELLATYERDGVPQTDRILERERIRNEVVVFGAYLPNKIALFDTGEGGAYRTRIVEGGAVVKDSTLIVSVTDWRLDTTVDKTSLDRYVGDRQSHGRFGPTIVPVFGEIEYEVQAEISTDGGASFQSVALPRVARPDVLASSDGHRFAHEGQIAVSAGAGPSIKTAFRVRAFLKVPNENLINGRYPAGSRVLLKETWDNNGGQDYALPIEAR